MQGQDHIVVRGVRFVYHFYQAYLEKVRNTAGKILKLYQEFGRGTLENR